MEEVGVMDLLAMVFFRKIAGGGSCPRAEGRSVVNVEDFLTQTCEQYGVAHIEQYEEE